ARQATDEGPTEQHVQHDHDAYAGQMLARVPLRLSVIHSTLSSTPGPSGPLSGAVDPASPVGALRFIPLKRPCGPREAGDYIAFQVHPRPGLHPSRLKSVTLFHPRSHQLSKS